MRRLFFDSTLEASIDQIWSKLAEVNNYPKYIKFCHKAELNGTFEAGSTWYDWSSVALVPMKITHEIISVKAKQEIVYKINLPFGGEIWQTLNLTQESGKTRFRLEATIELGNKLVDFFFGSFIYSRNKIMLESTINNIKQEIQNETN